MSDDLGPWRWTLDEYVLRCELTIEVRELVVEGTLDRVIYEDALSRWGLVDVQVIERSSLDISEAQVTYAGHQSGTKGALLTLASSLEPLVASDPERFRITVVLDRDYDDYVGAVRFRSVLLTDGYSVENYLVAASVIERLVNILLDRAQPREEKRVVSGNAVYGRLCVAAVQIAAVRLVLRSASPRLALFDKWLDYARIDRAGHITVDSESLLQNVLIRSARGDEFDELRTRLAIETNRVAADVVRLVRGHDFIELLAKLLRSKWGRGIAGMYARASERELARVLFPLIEDQLLDSFPLFAELRLRFE